MELRDYQIECIEEIERRGDGRWLVHMATGLGKTATFTHLPRHGRTLILSHRDELVRQPARYYDCAVGIEKAGERSHGEEVVSASVQTLSRGGRLGAFEPGEFDSVITDECHHAAAKSYRKIIEHLEPRVHLGFTATPNRGDRVSLEDVYDDVVFSRDLLWGITEGYLCDLTAQRVTVDWDLSSIPTSMGDYQQAKLAQAVNSGKCVEAVAEAVREMAAGPTLIFCVDVEHATRVAERVAGCEVVTGATPPGERRAILAAYEAGEVPAIANCMVLTEGTDLPCTQTVVVACPTRNDSLYQQMVGRGLRLHPGKELLTLVDVVGCTEDRKLVSAPSLAGLDPSCLDVCDLTGVRLTDMPAYVEAEESTPAGWLLRSRRIDPFWSSYDARGVRWLPMGDGSRSVAAGRAGLALSAPDSLGRATLTAVNNKTGAESTVAACVPVQQALDTARAVLERHAAEDRPLWDEAAAGRWAAEEASAAQLDLIARVSGADGLQRMREAAGKRGLSKGEACCVIQNALAAQNRRGKDGRRSGEWKL